MKKFWEKFKGLFKSDTDFKISLKDFADYCKNHGIIIVLTIVIIALAHGFNIFYNNLGIDTQVFIQDPTFNYNWEGLGRFGLLLERDILYLNPYSSFYAGVLMYIFIVLACVTMFYTFYKISGKDFGFINLCIPLICFTHPLFVEQFLFKLQCAEIACAAFLTTLAILWIFTWIKNNNYVYAVLGVLLAVLCFASYQSFVFIYISMCIFAFLLLNEDGIERSNFKTIIKLIVTFIISFLIYEFIINNVFLYLRFDNSVHWYTDSKRQIVLNILNHMKNVIIGSGPHYNLGYTFGVVFCLGILIYKMVKDKNTVANKIWYFLAFGMLFASPFFLGIVEGQTPLLRSQLALPYVEAFLIMFTTYYFFKNNLLKYASLVLIFCSFAAQMSITQTFYYTDKFKNDFEITTSEQIVHDLKEAGIEEKRTIVILGHIDPPYNAICKTGEIVGASSYNANHYGYPYYAYSTANILGVWKCLGYDFGACNGDQAWKAREINDAEKMPIWPAEGSIKDCGDFVIVKVSEDDLPW